MPVFPTIRRSACAALAAIAFAWAGWNLQSLKAADPPVVQFLPPAMFDTGEALPVDTERADLNNDGIADVAVLTTQGGGKIQILLGQAPLADGKARLANETAVTVAYASGIASGDLNSDGILDLVVTQTANKTAADGFCGIWSGTVVMLGTGGVTPGFVFGSCIEPIQNRYLTDAVVADFDRDGKLDIVAADDNFYSLSFYRGNGDGTFVTPGIRATDASGLHVFGPMTAVDVDRDGDLDVVATVSGIGTFFGDATGHFTFTSTAAGSNSPQIQGHMGVRSFALGDINADGLTDIVGIERVRLATTPITQANVLFASLGAGDGVTYLASDTHILPDGNVGNVVLSDINKDQALDAVAVDQDGNLVRVYLGAGNGVFADGPVTSVGLQPLFAVVSDWNADSWKDVAVVDRNQGNQSRTWMLQQIPGTADSTPPTVSLTAPAAGATLAGTATVSADATDTTGVARVDFYRGNVLIGSDTTAPYSLSWNSATAPNGPYTLTAQAFDTLDNAATSAGVAITVANPDTTAPTVSISSPAAGSWLSGTATATATATDFNGVARVEFSLGTTPVGTATTSPFSVSWSTTTFAPGSYTLSAKAFDAANNFAESTITVTVDQPPVAVAGPSPQVVEATSGSGASVTLTGTGTDLDAGDTLAFRWTEEGVIIGTTASLTLTLSPGIHALVFRVTDALGAFSEDLLQIEIGDTTPPSLVLPASPVREATGPSGATATFTVLATDIVDPASMVTCDRTSGSIFPLGVTTVTCQATDYADNISEGTFTITVQDTTPPALILPPGVTAEATSPAGAIVSYAASAQDVVSGAVAIACAPASNTLFAKGVTTVTCTASDTAGNSASGTFAVTVRDTVAPVLSLPSPISRAASGTSAVVTFTATAVDALDGARPVVCTPPSGSSFPLGATTVTCTSADASGNTSSGTFTVTVTDGAGPVLSLPANLSLVASGTSAVATFDATATDALDGARSVVCTPPSGSSLPIGVTTVTCTAADASGNSSSGSFTVTITDGAGPVLALPHNLVLVAAGTSAVATFDATATDAIDGARPVVCTPPSGASFPIGVTTVTCTSSDAAGNASSGTFTVTVTDGAGPALALPVDQTVEAASSAGAIVTFTATALDDVDGARPVICSPSSGSTFPAGVTTVNCTATDLAGNSRAGSFTITARDTTAPTVTAPAPLTVAATEESGARANIATSTASQALSAFLAGGSAADLHDAAPARLSPQVEISGTWLDATASRLFPVGSTNVRFRYIDSSGNVGSATSSVGVTAPVGGAVDTPRVPVVVTDASNASLPLTVSFAGVTEPGLVTATVIPVPAAPPAGFVFGGQVYDIVTTAAVVPPIVVCVPAAAPTDRLLHFENGAWVDVTTTASTTQVCGSVMSLSPFAAASVANRPPTANAGPPQTVEATSSIGAAVTLSGSGSDPDAGDALSFRWAEGTTELGTGAQITVTLAVGAHALTLTVTDSHGEAATSTTAVTIIDSVPPMLTLPADRAIEAATAAGSVMTFDTTADDAIDGSRPVTCAPASGATFPLGTTTVTCSSADLSGNVATGTFTVTIRDVTAPSITLTAPMNGSNVSGSVTVSASASDNGGVVRVEFFADGAPIGSDTSAPFSATWSTGGLPAGTAVTLAARAVDGAGNAGDASIVVTVVASKSDKGKDKGPKITSRDLPGELPVGVPLAFQLTATGAQPLAWSLGSVPAGVAINPVTGLLSWTPSPSQLGKQQIFVRVTSATGATTFEKYKVEVVDNDPPTAPTNLEAVSVTRSRVTLRWAASTDNVGVAYYRVYEYVRRNGTYVWKVVDERARDLSETISGVDGGTHTYAVTAMDSSGNESGRSEAIVVVVPGR